MELRHLRYFVAVAEEEHLGRAARRLHVSPPPLSKQIQQLEEEVGVPLFARVGRGLKLTDSGRVFLERCHAILAEVSRSVAAAQASSRGEIGHLALGFTETGTYASMIPDIVARIRERHPHVAIELLPMSWSEQVTALLAGRINASFCNHVPAERGIRSTVLLAERIVVAMPAQHRLARRKAVSVLDVRDEPFVWIPRDSIPQQFRKSIAELASRGVTPNVVVEARSSAMRLGMVAAGMGLTFALESGGPMLPPDVVRRPVSDVSLTVDSVVAWRAEDDDSVVLRSLRQVAEAVARTRRTARGRAARPPSRPAAS